MISQLCQSLCLTSFTTGLLVDIVALGDSIRAPCGGIVENWPFKGVNRHSAVIAERVARPQS